MKGAKAHTRYKTSDGKAVPGVTTVTGLLAKPQLIKWANNLGLQGIDSTKYVDKAARIGSCAHEMIEMYLKNKKFESDQYSPDEVNQAENALIKFYEWEKGIKFFPLASELQLVHEVLLYGGTVDCVADIDGKTWLVDFKTGKSIYDEMAMQLAAYREMLTYHGHKIEGCRIIRVGRDETEGFEDRIFSQWEIDKGFDKFMCLLDFYHIDKQKEDK